MENNIDYKKARKRVEAKIGFFIHLTVYILVNCFLITTNLIHSSETIWSIRPLFGWGIGLMFHGLGVFFYPGIDKIKERMIQKEMQKGGVQ